MRILVPGGCGYIGARLVPFLLADGHKVTVFDTMWFGDGSLPDNPNLTVIKGDVRDINAIGDAALGQDVVIWLASISNNAMYGVNYKQTHSANTFVRYFPVSKFIYASSVAVLDPTSDYAKDKLYCESLLKDSGAIIVRAASVVGYSPHQRLDTTINMMTNDAYRKGVITVNGGKQRRTHIHIDDVCDFYRLSLTKAEAGKTYTIWKMSETVRDAAEMVSASFLNEGKSVRIETKPSTDDRSYGLCWKGDDIFEEWVKDQPTRDRGHRLVSDAVRDLIIKFDSGYWPDSLTNPIFQNMRDAI